MAKYVVGLGEKVADTDIEEGFYFKNRNESRS